MNLPEGTKITELKPWPHWLDDTLSSKGLSVGDLVSYSQPSWNNHMTLYRIVKDSPPDKSAVWGSYKYYTYGPRSIITKKGWVYPDTGKVMSLRHVQGYVEIEPAYQVLRGPYRPSKKVIPYNCLRKLKRLDIVELAKAFSNLRDFVNEEARRGAG